MILRRLVVTKLLAKNPNWVWKALEIVPTEKFYPLDLVELRDGKISRNEVYFDPSRLIV